MCRNKLTLPDTGLPPRGNHSWALVWWIPCTSSWSWSPQAALGPLLGRRNLPRASCFLLPVSQLLAVATAPYCHWGACRAPSNKGVWLLFPGAPRHCQSPLRPGLFLPSGLGSFSPPFRICIPSWGPQGTAGADGSKPGWGGKTEGHPEGGSRAAVGTWVLWEQPRGGLAVPHQVRLDMPSWVILLKAPHPSGRLDFVFPCGYFSPCSESRAQCGEE